MDASLAAALEGLKAVGQAAAESIVSSSSSSASSSDDGGRADRVAFCAAADVETACVSVLGKDAEEEEAIAPAAANKRGGGSSGGFLSRLHEGLEGLGIGRGHSSAEAAAASAAAAAAASAAAAALPPPPAPTAASLEPPVNQAAVAAWRAAQLAPITDILVVHAGDVLPPGYTRVAHSVTGMYPADLNAVRRRVCIP
jgi:hypothetical protein